jgi:hypothetical protein
VSIPTILFFSKGINGGTPSSLFQFLSFFLHRQTSFHLPPNSQPSSEFFQTSITNIKMQLLAYVFGFLSVLTLVSASPFPLAGAVDDYSDLPYPVVEAVFDPEGVSDVSVKPRGTLNKVRLNFCIQSLLQRAYVE